MNMDRRAFLGGLSAAIAAPFVVKSGVLMPVKAIIKPTHYRFTEVSIDGTNWYEIAYVNLKSGLPIDFRGRFNTIEEYASNTFKHSRIIFGNGWTPTWDASRIGDLAHGYPNPR